MRSVFAWNRLAAVACTTAFAGVVGLTGPTASAVVIYGIGSNPASEERLVSFRSDNVEAGNIIPFDTAVSITGLQPNERLVGIDFRPSNGLLYGVGSTSRIYTINTATGAATPVVLGQFSTLLNGTEFGLVFDPVGDGDGDPLTPSLRLVSDLEQNMRINADSGQVTLDPAITRSGSTPGTINVAAAAYENDDADPNTGARLFVIDATENNLNLMNPATGVLTRVGFMDNTTSLIGFDILTSSPGTNTGYAAYQQDPVFGPVALSTVNLSTGTGTLAGFLGEPDGTFLLRSIAVVPIPEPAGLTILFAAGAALLRRRRK
jgi:hypothetical protein